MLTNSDIMTYLTASKEGYDDWLQFSAHTRLDDAGVRYSDLADQFYLAGAADFVIQRRNQPISSGAAHSFAIREVI